MKQLKANPNQLSIARAALGREQGLAEHAQRQAVMHRHTCSRRTWALRQLLCCRCNASTGSLQHVLSPLLLQQQCLLTQWLRLIPVDRSSRIRNHTLCIHRFWHQTNCSSCSAKPILQCCLSLKRWPIGLEKHRQDIFVHLCQGLHEHAEHWLQPSCGL